MKVKHRINARKLVLVFFYVRYFSDTQLEESSIAKDADFDLDLQYYLEYGLEKDPEKVDFGFAMKLIQGYDKHIQSLIDLVNNHATTFQSEQMDGIDMAIFLLGYIESQVADTPRKVILNEMIELAKAYGDDGSAKLINGIGHHIIPE